MLETVSKGFRAAKNRLAWKAEISPELVDESLRSIRDAILIGIVLCVAVIALFLRDFRGGLVAAVALEPREGRDT